MPAVISCSASVHSEVRVQGSAAAVRIDAHEAPLPEVLGALGTSLGVRYTSLIALDEVVIAGTYSGPLDDVLRRMLKGFNYVIKSRDETLEVIIVGRPGNPPPPAANREPASPANANPAAQWRKPTAQRP
jgi:hypothetical protein